MARIIVLVMLAAAAAITFSVGAAPPAQALCITPPEEGAWRNIDADTRGITRVRLRSVCQDVVLNGEPYPPGPPWYVHLFGKCHPTDCDWGEVGATRLSGGHIYAYYNQGFARRHVFARMSQYLPGDLWVYIYTDFTDPARPDYAMHNWFAPE